jgi:hypothetical protein
MTTLPEIIGALVSDAFELTGTHGGSIAGAVIGRYFRRRGEQARDILFEELRQANISDAQATSEDDAIAVIVRYLRAAREGAARLNLRLLAKAIAGKLQSGHLVADEFLQYTEALGSLSRDEIIVIAAVYRVWTEHQILAATNPAEATKYTDPWVLAMRKLTSESMTEELVTATAARAQRSGLIYAIAAPSTRVAGGTSGSPIPLQAGTDFPSVFFYRITPMLVEVGKTVDFQDALLRETSRQD